MDMSAPRTIAVVGYKNSGKTRVIEVLARELTDRGYKVGSLKHTVEDIDLDIEGKDTWRHLKAGVLSTSILSDKGTAFFHNTSMDVTDAIERIGPVDFIIIEGFKSLDYVPRLIVPRKERDIEELSNGLELAIINTQEMVITSSTPIIPLRETSRVADIVEQRAFPMLPGINCRSCGYESCHDMAKALIRDEEKASSCVYHISKELNLKVNEETIALNQFVQQVFQNVLTALIKTLKGIDETKTIEIKYQVEDEDNE
jgi:molybdopterin-guanine dinucleotide biosynthesis protein B